MAGELAPATIPNFSLGGSQTPFPNNAAAFGQAFSSGMNAQQNQQALNLQQQQQNIQQVDTLLKNGIELPGLLPSFWPTIATKMNQISPDYKLDPANPPQNLLSYSKALSDISDGVQGGIVSPPQAHNAVLQLNKTTFPNAQDALGGGQPQPQQPPPQGQPAPPPQTPPPGGQPPPQAQGSPLDAFAALKAQYDKASATIAVAPLSQQAGLRQQLDNSTLGTMYKKSLDQLATQSNQQYTESQQNQRNQYNQDQDSIRSLATSFDKDTADNQNAFNNFNVFNTQMRLSKQFAGSKDTTAAVNTEKAALMAYAQMAFPGTGRPGNPEAMEEMARSGSFGTLVQQRMNQLDKGEIMTDTQVMGLRQSALGIAQAREQSHTDLENSAAQGIQLHGGNPHGFLKNYRPSTLASTSKLYPNQNPQAAGTIKKLTINGKPGTYQLLTAGGAGDPNNWAPVADND